MRVDEIINLIDPDTKIAIRINGRVEANTVILLSIFIIKSKC